MSALFTNSIRNRWAQRFLQSILVGGLVLITSFGCSAKESQSGKQATTSRVVDVSYKPPTYSTLKEAVEQRDSRLRDAMAMIASGTRKAEGYLKAGRVMLSIRNIPLAIECFNLSLENDPNLYEVYYRRAFAYRYILQYEKSLQDYDRFLEFAPKSIEGRFQRAYTVHLLGDSDKALKILNDLVRKNPNNVSAINYRGLVFKGMKEFDRAVEDFKTVMQLEPRYPYASYNIARISYERGDDSTALAMYSESVKQDPAYAPGYCGRAYIKMKMGLLVPGAEDYKLSTIAKPWYGRAYYHMGRNSLKLGLYTDAIHLLTMAIERDHYYARYDWSYTYRSQAYDAIGCPFRAEADRRMAHAVGLVAKIKEQKGPKWKNEWVDETRMKAGDSLLVIAVRLKKHYLATAFLMAGANPDAVNPEDGKTALHYACENGRMDTARVLLDYGAKPDIKDKAGKTPLDYHFGVYSVGNNAIVYDVIYSRIKKLVGKDIRSNKNLSVHVNAILLTSALTMLDTATTIKEKSQGRKIEDNRKALHEMEEAHIAAMAGMALSDDGGKPRNLAAIMQEEHDRHAQAIESFTAQSINRMPIEVILKVEKAIWYTELVVGRNNPIYDFVVKNGLDVLGS